MPEYTHIIVHCRSENDTRDAYAFLSGDEVTVMAGNGFKLRVKAPDGMLDPVKVCRVAPRALRIDKKDRTDIDFARIRQILVAQLRLVERFEFCQELDGLSS